MFATALEIHLILIHDIDNISIHQCHWMLLSCIPRTIFVYNLGNWRETNVVWKHHNDNNVTNSASSEIIYVNMHKNHKERKQRSPYPSIWHTASYLITSDSTEGSKGLWIARVWEMSCDQKLFCIWNSILMLWPTDRWVGCKSYPDP